MEATAEEVQVTKYPAFKDSGVEWLGEIPAHWVVLRGKRFHNVIKESNSKKQCNNVLSLTLRGVVNNSPDSPEGMVPKDYGTYQIFYKDDIVFKLIDLENIRTSRVGIVHEKGIMSPAYIRLSLGEGNYPRYAYYYYYSLYLNEVYNKVGAGVRSTLGPTDLLNLPFIKPRVEEQTAIAQFLDRKTAQIDKAISIKEKQITLLKERRQVLIHQAVTRGLNPNAPLKYSSVEWIGEIPAHWETKRVKYLFKQSRLDPDKNDGVVTAFRDGEVTLRTNRRTEGFTIAILEQGYQKIRKGQLVLNSMDAFEGAIGVSDSEGKCSPEYVICDPLTDAVSPKYFSLLFREMALAKYIQVICNAVRERAIRIRYNNLAPLFVAVPPIEEQLRIISYVENLKQSTNKVIASREKEIEKLKEYKASLINSAVTGKIKVC